MLPLRQPSESPPPSLPWGSRAAVGAMMRELDDLLGNRDGLWHNEVRPAGTLPTNAPKSPRQEATRQALSTGLSTTDEQATLTEFLAVGEARWGQPVTELHRSMHFAVTKALLLARLHRSPDTVRDTFVHATGAIAGTPIPPREVRVRCFAPTAPANHRCVVVVPGHAVPLDAALDTIVALNHQGFAVVAMAHPWRDDPTRGPTRGFGLARDVAAVVAAAQDVWPTVSILGSSVGAVGVLGALILAPLHTPVDVVLEAPWPGGGWCFTDPPDLPTASGGHRPDTALLTRGHPEATARATQLAVLSDLRVPDRLLARLEPDLAHILARVADGVRPTGRVHIVAARHDPLADLDLVSGLAAALDAPLHIVDTAVHLLGLLDPTPALQHLQQPVAAPIHGPHGAARDRSLRFSVLAARAARGEDVLPADAREPVYLTVPGLFTERYPMYMRDKFARMAAHALDHTMVPIDTDQGIEQNADQIRHTLLEHTTPHRRAILLGHSKGGLDIAAALAFFPELRPRVRAVVTLQAPWLGTPIADLVENQSVLAWANRFIVEGAFNGDARALTDLGLAARADFVARHPWPEEVPAVCLASSLRSWKTLLAVPDALLNGSHGPTDGMVPVANAILPGSDAVLVRDVDHGGPVLPRPLGSCAHLTPGDMTVALITLALERSAG